MAVFSVVVKDNVDIDTVKGLVEKNYPNEKNIPISTTAWLVHEQESVPPRNVYSKLFGKEDSAEHNPKPLLIQSVNAYYGFHDVDIWEWLRGKIES